MDKGVCFSGTSTGEEQCGFIVTDEDLCMRVDARRSGARLLCGLTAASSSAYGTAPISGDSGGPVYSMLTNGNVVAAGIVSGSTDRSTLIYTPVKVIREGLWGEPWTCTAAGGC